MTEIFYHYTNADGLLEILGQKCIWCTHIAYLNDSQEHKFGVNLYADLLAEISRDERQDDMTRRIASAALEHLPRDSADPRRYSTTFRSHPPLVHPYDYFVASFCEQADVLSQWRAYSGEGPKFSIGFRRDALASLSETSSFQVGQVSYDSKAAYEGMKQQFLDRKPELIKRIPRHANGDPYQIHPPEYYNLNNQIADSVQPLLKHSAFKEEREWRIYTAALKQFAMGGSGAIIVPTEKFRPGRSYLVPYVEADLSGLRQPIASITIGPSVHPVEARAAVMRLVRTIAATWSELECLT